MLKANKFKILDAFQYKARCVWTERKTSALLRKLKPFLDVEQTAKISTAVSRIDSGEGPWELDDVCKSIRESWS